MCLNKFVTSMDPRKSRKSVGDAFNDIKLERIKQIDL